MIVKALAKEPEERYASCGELVEAARAALLSGAPASADTPAAPATSDSPAVTAPLEPATDCLRLRVTAGNAQGSEIQVEDELLIGRQASEEGTLGQDAEISREHARITRSGGNFAIEDLGSTNGTFVNGRQISRAEILSPGDRIQVGATTLVVQVSVPFAAEPSAEPAVPAAAPPDADTRSSAQTPMPEQPATAPVPPLSLRLDFDPEAGEVTLRLGDDSDPVKLVYENGSWRLAPDGGPG